MKVLVTGSLGFTGLYMVQNLLDHGHVVHSLKADLTDRFALQSELELLELDSVIHLAAISNVSHSRSSAYCLVNVVGTSNLLEVLSATQNECSVLLASSGQVYGGGRELSVVSYLPLKEDDQANPQNEYAISKYAMELVARLWADRFSLIIARPFNYTGVGQSTNFVVPKIVDHFKRGLTSIELGNINLFREFGDVRDVVECYRVLIERRQDAPRQNQVVNICTEIPVRLIDVLNRCEEITDHKIDIKTNNAFIRAGEPEILIGDRTCLRSLTGRDVVYTLKETLNWMMQV